MTTTNFNKRQMLKYVGNFSQVFGIKEYALTSGKAKGVKAFDVKTGSGLEFTVLADRCLDISGLSFKGTNCSYISKTGIVAPEYYEENGVGFLRSFTAGFLTTCGLRNVGSPCEKDGEPFSMHGRIANTPGEEVSATTEWVDDVPVLTINGKMREARVFGENLVLGRKITCKYGENKITIENTVENLGFRKEALMLLFHFNMTKFAIRSFAVKFEKATLTTSKPEQKSIEIPFNEDVISFDNNRTDGNMTNGLSFPAELIPAKVTSEDICFNMVVMDQCTGHLL